MVGAASSAPWPSGPLLLSHPRLTFGSPDSGASHRTQGGITLSLEEGELDADFCTLGMGVTAYIQFSGILVINSERPRLFGPSSTLLIIFSSRSQSSRE
jgi:hypothetical protein